MGGSRAAQASGWRYKALGMVSAHSLLTLLFMSTGVKDAHGIIGQKGEDGWEDAGRTKQTRERTAGGRRGRACCCHGKLMPGQTEPDLHPNTVLISELLFWDSLIFWDICGPSLWCRKHRQAMPRHLEGGRNSGGVGLGDVPGGKPGGF